MKWINRIQNARSCLQCASGVLRNMLSGYPPAVHHGQAVQLLRSISSFGCCEDTIAVLFFSRTGSAINELGAVQSLLSDPIGFAFPPSELPWSGWGSL